MDTLLSIAGGQPLKVEDWNLIQDQEKKALASILIGLSGVSACIIDGLVMTNDGTNINITEGYVFIVDEIFYVPAVTFPIDNSKILYLVSNFSTTENRTFHDTTTHDVWAYRRYQIVYLASAPGSYYVFTHLSTLISLVNNIIIAGLQTNLTALQSLAYSTGFTGATAYNAVSIQGNGINGYMIQAAFNATAGTSGKLCSLPVGLRPSADLVGYFFNNSVAPGILKIKRNGDVYVSGASISAPNYITFQFFLNFVDMTGFSLPTTGGGMPTGDHI